MRANTAPLKFNRKIWQGGDGNLIISIPPCMVGLVERGKKYTVTLTQLEGE